LFLIYIQLINPNVYILWEAYSSIIPFKQYLIFNKNRNPEGTNDKQKPFGVKDKSKLFKIGLIIYSDFNETGFIF